MGYHLYQPGVLGAIVVFDLTIQILGIIGNLIVLIAVINSKIGLVGFKRFLVSLLVNNIFLSVSQVVTAIYLEAEGALDRDNSCASAILESLKLFAVFAALFNLCGMSVDHLIGTVKQIKYEYLMKTRMAKMAPIIIWIVSFILAFADIFVAAVVYHTSDEYYSSSPLPSTEILDLFDNSQQQPVFSNSNADRDNTTTATPSFYQIFEHDPFELDSFFEDSDQVNLLMQEETDWCLISHSYKVYWVLWFRLFLTIAVFAFLLACYGRILYEIRKLNSEATSSLAPLVLNFKLAAQGKANNYGAVCQKPSQQRRSSRKFILITFSLLSTFAVCWLPIVILEIFIVPNMIGTTEEDLHIVARFHLVQHVFNSLFLSYPFIDSIICVIRVRAVRKFFFDLPHKCFFQWRKLYKPMSNYGRMPSQSETGFPEILSCRKTPAAARKSINITSCQQRQFSMMKKVRTVASIGKIAQQENSDHSKSETNNWL